MTEEDPAEEKSSSATTANGSVTSNATPNILTRDEASCVQVAVRVRPVLALEGDDANCMEVQRPPGAKYAIGIQVGGGGGPRFTFDQVFGMRTTQDQIYAERVAPLVISCLEGYNATILAYGQTGSGVSRKEA
jgi:hypothetical protein